jgi:hypothetical protein
MDFISSVDSHRLLVVVKDFAAALDKDANP